MTRDVKTHRTYDATGRRDRALRTRAEVLDSARALFLEQGYAATTMSQIAGGANVSVEMIYKSIGNKHALLKAVLDVAIVGDDEPVPMLQREMVARMRAEPDPRRMLGIYGEHIVVSWPRQVPVQLITRAAAAVDPAARDLWEAMQAERLAGMSLFAQNVADRGFLRPGLTAEDARDVLWALTAPEQYEILVVQRDWPMERVGRFIVDAMIGTLLPHHP
jgi:AcrR family transcriptional regulator